ncbi:MULTISPECIES: hypothetical protein [unclassified Fusibacter]|uniref:hypothetical protein n=1 Tax=unclassified Fusibacter TaxID=2624464 RepID=UPI001012AF81|nr:MULTISPECIES: hypothetical protein [unclassified Fusibacter]MCK8059669.1 hypothetical protein [Fusibacter sp. A2]NPE21470.1 hypothetical protein [Fusibacter sp. A1]RXV61881.1 hypothetical protein DWB64_06485 [Fusibacter sp. A1]
MTVYVVTLFKIISEIRIQDMVSQEIDKRVLKQFESEKEAIDYLRGIKNQMMMYNFPFAMIQEFELEDIYYISNQVLYLFDDLRACYLPIDGMAGLSQSTRRKLHEFDTRVEFRMK